MMTGAICRRCENLLVKSLFQSSVRVCVDVQTRLCAAHIVEHVTNQRGQISRLPDHACSKEERTSI